MAPVRYRKWPNPYDRFRRLPGADKLGAKSVSGSGKRVLLLPLRVTSTSNLVEGVIGAALKLDGHQVFALLDGGVLRYSDNATVGKSWPVANALSVYEQHQFCRTFGVEPCYYSDLLDSRRVAHTLKEIGGARTYDELMESQYRGIPLGRHANSSVMRYLRQETVNVPENVELLRHFLETALKTAMAVESLVQAKQITHAFMSHGIYSTWGAAMDMLILEGVQVGVWGRGYIGGNPIFGRNQSYLAEAIEESIADVREYMAPYDVDQAFLDSYFAAKAKPGSGVDVVSYYETQQNSAAEFAAGLREGFDGLISIFPNIPWDGTMFAASAYTRSLREFAGKVVFAAKQFPRLRFVVRCHPAERHREGNNSRETFSSFFSEADRRIANLKIIESDASTSSYDLFPVTDAALIFGTSMGTELVLRDIPVIQTGKNELVNKGVLFEVASDAELVDLLNKVQAGTLSLSEDMRANARDYAYYFIKLCHVQDDMIEIDRYRFVQYKFDAVDSLGGDSLPSCDAIKKFALGETKKCINPYVERRPI